MISRQGAALRLDGVTFSYGSTLVIRNLSLDVQPGEMIALLGASGCGKTTLLKLIAGLLPSGNGTISFDGEAMNDVPVEMRQAGVVFQKPLLFPYLSVEENIGFSLKMRGISRLEASDRICRALATVRLKDMDRGVLASYPVDQNSAWRWLERSSAIPASSCSMSPSLLLTRTCGPRFAHSSAGFKGSWASPPSLLATIAARLPSWPIESLFSMKAASSSAARYATSMSAPSQSMSRASLDGRFCAA